MTCVVLHAGTTCEAMHMLQMYLGKALQHVKGAQTTHLAHL